jgi:hypothetical protein
MACSGDANEICGGPNAINIYIDASNVPATVVLPAGWTTYGVVTEGDNGRLLPVQILNDNTNTVEVCAQACFNAGYTISGTEYSSECYCGNAFVAVSSPPVHFLSSLITLGCRRRQTRRRFRRFHGLFRQRCAEMRRTLHSQCHLCLRKQHSLRLDFVDSQASFILHSIHPMKYRTLPPASSLHAR